MLLSRDETPRDVEIYESCDGEYSVESNPYALENVSATLFAIYDNKQVFDDESRVTQDGDSFQLRVSFCDNVIQKEYTRADRNIVLRNDVVDPPATLVLALRQINRVCAGSNTILHLD